MFQGVSEISEKFQEVSTGFQSVAAAFQRFSRDFVGVLGSYRDV